MFIFFFTAAATTEIYTYLHTRSLLDALPIYCGTAHHGINILVLGAQASRRGYANPYWMTYNQAQELGGKVRAGEKGTAIVFAGAVTPKDESGQPVEREGEEIGRGTCRERGCQSV